MKSANLFSFLIKIKTWLQNSVSFLIHCSPFSKLCSGFIKFLREISSSCSRSQWEIYVNANEEATIYWTYESCFFHFFSLYEPQKISFFGYNNDNNNSNLKAITGTFWKVLSCTKKKVAWFIFCKFRGYRNVCLFTGKGNFYHYIKFN